MLIKKRYTKNLMEVKKVLVFSDVPDSEESGRFWGDIWSVGKEHDGEAGWLKDLKNESNGEHIHEMVRVSVENVKNHCRRFLIEKH